ncbi:MAG: 2Fe-2S iron-sulfur cluster binding domain-containing protein [Planctomycetes bacterium]|nr:2Fe-2S iron-sulfur cluster binding domain-containing protein [Planctomycetota bacterium]
MRHSDEPKAPPTVKVTFILQDPKSLGKEEKEITVMAGKGENLLEVAMENGINIEHACGGVCACSTCHIYVNKGEQSLSEATDAELDRVEEAPDLRRNSRLSCQSVIRGDGPITVEVPAWNRNAVKEQPH